MPPAIAAPNVPTKTRIMGGGSSRLAGLLPSMTMDTPTAPKTRPMPTGVPSSMSALRAGHEGERGHGRRSQLLAVPLRGDEDGGAVGADLVDQQLDGLLDDVLHPSDEGDHGVRSLLDALDQIRVQREPGAVTAGHDDHRRHPSMEQIERPSVTAN